MILRGIINLQGLSLSATVRIEDNLSQRIKGISFCPNIGEQGKWRAYHNVCGQTRHLGYYDTKEKAIEAARAKRNLTGKPIEERAGVYGIARGETTVWRSTYTPSVGRRLRLGEYATKGAAILVRDVVARRSGGAVAVQDYEMPLSFVTNPVARSFIREAIPTATATELEEYERRVADLNGLRRVPVERQAVALPDEAWRQQQPSRVGRSPFDMVE